MRKGYLSIPLILSLFLSIATGCNEVSENEILWDNFGVPHIYASTTEGMYYSFGQAQMHNHGNLILKLYAQARGEAASIFGEEYLESDKLIKLMRLDIYSAEAYLDQDPEYKGYIDAFVKGINDYARNNPHLINDDCKKVLPVTPGDILAHTLRVISIEFLASEDIYTVKRLTDPGSNAIAIAPSRSASGRAMLMSNPHLPWSGYFTWFEAHLIAGDFNLYGVSLVGMPTLTIAFNENLGWTHTVNTIDGSDRYELVTDGDSYLFDNKKVPFEKREVTIEVLQKDGSKRNDTVELKYSKHGPVCGEKKNKAWAVRIAGLENARIFEQYHKMGLAKSFDEFESAVRMLQNPMFNIVYADRDGHIFYLFNGNIPARQKHDFSFWRGTIPGEESNLLWDSYLPYDSLPRVLDPPSGFLQNCNDPPWICTYPAVLDPESFPEYVAPRGMGLRPQRAVNLLLRDSSITFDELVDIKLNTGMESADRYLDELLSHADKSADNKVSEAVKILKAWERKSDTDSRGALLFAEWWDIARTVIGQIPWDPDRPTTTPYGIKDPEKAVRLLGEAYDNSINKYGSADVATGDIFRMRINEHDVPSNGGPEHYGILRAMYYSPDDDGKMRTVAGDTWYAITEFGPEVRAVAVLSYGNASQPGSIHSGDQFSLMSEKKMRKVLFYRNDVEEHTVKRDVLAVYELSQN